MKNFVKPGASIDNYLAGSNLASGAVVVLGAQIGVVAEDIASGDTGVVNLEGVFNLLKKSGVAFAIGDKLYWHATDGLTKTQTDVPAGICFKTAESADVLAHVKLVPMIMRQAAVVAANATANGSDAATTQALANSLKTSVNDILTALKNAGLMASA
jgi:predicted RecA/RadA family phage recombinase